MKMVKVNVEIKGIVTYNGTVEMTAEEFTKWQGKFEGRVSDREETDFADDLISRMGLKLDQPTDWDRIGFHRCVTNLRPLADVESKIDYSSGEGP